MNVRRMAEHVAKICAKHEITHMAPTTEASKISANRRTQQIIAPRVTSEVSYAVALHELGHLLGQWQGPTYLEIEREAGAWKWALKTMRCSPTLKIWALIHASLDTYFRNPDTDAWVFDPANSERPVKRRIMPQDNSPAWKVFAMIGEGRLEEFEERDNVYLADAAVAAEFERILDEEAVEFGQLETRAKAEGKEIAERYLERLTSVLQGLEPLTRKAVREARKA